MYNRFHPNQNVVRNRSDLKVKTDDVEGVVELMVTERVCSSTYHVPVLNSCSCASNTRPRTCSCGVDELGDFVVPSLNACSCASTPTDVGGPPVGGPYRGTRLQQVRCKFFPQKFSFQLYNRIRPGVVKILQSSDTLENNRRLTI